MKSWIAVAATTAMPHSRARMISIRVLTATTVVRGAARLRAGSVADGHR
jgi:hypothetical protein